MLVVILYPLLTYDFILVFLEFYKRKLMRKTLISEGISGDLKVKN